MWLRAWMVAAASPVVLAASSSRAVLSDAPAQALRVAPRPLRASSAATIRRPAPRTAKTATRAASPTMARAAGAPVTSRPSAVSGSAPPPVAAWPSAQVWPEARRTTVAPAAPRSRPAARERRLPAESGAAPDAESAVRARGWGTGTALTPSTIPYRPDARGAGRPSAVQRPWSRLAVWTARSTAAALLRHSVSSATGSESATTPAPAWTYAVPSRRRAVRMAMAVSESPAKSR